MVAAAVILNAAVITVKGLEQSIVQLTQSRFGIVPSLHARVHVRFAVDVCNWPYGSTGS